MTHDPLCPVASPLHENWCQCAPIARVRADERKKVINDATSVDAVAKRAAEVITPLVYADLRAKVKALHPDWLGTPDDVLALIDGGQ